MLVVKLSSLGFGRSRSRPRGSWWSRSTSFVVVLDRSRGRDGHAPTERRRRVGYALLTRRAGPQARPEAPLQGIGGVWAVAAVVVMATQRNAMTTRTA